MGAVQDSILDHLFDLMVHTAIEGQRCPTNDQLPDHSLPALARAGKVRIEVFERNWRVVTILVGPHAGKQTSRGSVRPEAKPYIVIDASSAPRRTSIPSRHRQKPWRPGDPRPGG